MNIYLRKPEESLRLCQEDSSWRNHVIRIADLSIGNTFIFTDKYEMERCEKPVTFPASIDWDFIPYGDPEWCYAFSRHTFLLSNAAAAAITGEQRYRDNWIRLFEDFFTRSKLTEKTKTLSWRSLECGIRIENYIRSLELFDGMGMTLPESVLDDISAFLAVHIEWLLEAHTDFHRISNWGILQDHGLFLAALYLGDREAMDTALSRLDEEMAMQTLPDGMHWEQSSMYHGEILHAALDTILAAERSGISVPDTLRSNTHLAALGLARSLRPDGKCCLMGDSDEIDMRDMAAEAAVMFGDAELSYYAQGGLSADFWLSHEPGTELPEPEKPGCRSFFFRESGNAILTLSDDTVLRFRCGFTGSGHGHIDQLHFDLWNRGRMIITDTGRYTYTDTEERRALKGAHGHNTVILGGKEPSRMEDSWEIAPVADTLFCDAVTEGEYRLLRAAHTGYAADGALIMRTVATIGDRFIIIADDITAGKETSADILIHFDEGTSVKEEGGSISACAGESSVRIIPDSALLPEISGSIMSRRYNELLRAPMLTMRGRCSGRRCFITVIGIGEKDFSIAFSPVIRMLTGTAIPESIARAITIKDGDDSYSIGIVAEECHRGGFLLKAGEAEAYGRVFIRKNGEKTKVLRY